LIIGYLLTAVIEEIYRKLSALKQQTQQNIEAVKDKAQAPARVIKSTVASTKSTMVNTGKLIGGSSKKLYDSTLKITNATVDLGISNFKKIADKVKWKKRKKNTEVNNRE